MATGRKDYWLSALVTQSTYDVDVDVPPNQYIHGWDAVEEEWVKLMCTDEGKLIIDPSEIFENPPTEDEATKAPTSEWSYDHWKNANAHHTHVIGYKAPDSFDYVPGISLFDISAQAGWPCPYALIVTHWSNVYRNIQWCYSRYGLLRYFRSYYSGTGWTAWRKIMTLPEDGVQYWSCNGVHFDALYPDINDITKNDSGYFEVNENGVKVVASVNLPSGAVVTAVKVYGNAAAADSTWWLERIGLDNSGLTGMSTANVNSEDSTVVSATIDNSLYCYYINLNALSIGDIIYGARITYTL